MAPSGSSSAPEGSRWSRWGKTAFDKSMVVSDWASGYANAASAKAGGERFWPKSNDMVEEIEKCARILRAFTVEGLETQQAEEEAEVVVDAKGNKVKKRRKVLKKIPPKAIKNAKGIVIYTAMRTGIAPFGGAGGTGLVLARLPDGTWSAPASVSPNNLSVGLLLGVDIFDVILLLNSVKALESFFSHKVTLGAEMAVVAGPVGSGSSLETGIERAPVYSYVKSRGFYAGVEAIAQVFLSRFDENERFYYWPGIKGEDILKGKVKMPASVIPLHRALADAESGRAQGDKLERTVYDVVKIPNSELMARLSRADSGDATPDGEVMLQDGERLRLPPTPAELDALEAAGIPDEEDVRLAQKEREEVYKLPAPPMHQKVKSYWDQHPNKWALRSTHQLTFGGPARAKAKTEFHSGGRSPSPWEVPLPGSPQSGTETLPPAYQGEVENEGEDEDGQAQYALDMKQDKEVTIMSPPIRKGETGKAANESISTSTSKRNRAARKAVPSGAVISADETTSGQSPTDNVAASGIPKQEEEARLSETLALNVENESMADTILQQAVAEASQSGEANVLEASVHASAEGEKEVNLTPKTETKETNTQDSSPTGILGTQTASGGGGDAADGTGSASLSRQSSASSSLLPPQRPSRARGREQTSTLPTATT